MREIAFLLLAGVLVSVVRRMLGIDFIDALIFFMIGVVVGMIYEHIIPYRPGGHP